MPCILDSKKYWKNHFFTLRNNLKFVVDQEISDGIKKNKRLWRVQSIIDRLRTVCISFPKDKIAQLMSR